MVRNWPVPKTAKDIQIFLGKTGYYRKFIKNYSAIALPLSDYIKQANEVKNFHVELKLSPEAITSFNDLKNALCNAPILAFPDFESSEPFILDTDFSGQNIGAVLSQKQDGKERVIAYGARKLLPREASYASNKGEMLACVYFIEKFKYFLSHRKFLLRTDHQALKWLATMKAPKGMYARWQELLSTYDFDVIFRKGEQHANADCLSRIDHAPDADQDDAERLAIHAISNAPKKVLTDADLQVAQENDPEMHDVIRWVKDQKKPHADEIRMLGSVQRSYADRFEKLYLSRKGVLLMQMDDEDRSGRRYRICIPQQHQEFIVNSVHNLGHQGIEATYYKIRQRFYFPDMAKRVELFVKTCIPCQKKLGKNSDQRHTLHDVAVGTPAQKWCIDLVGPLEADNEGYQHLLTARDAFTRYIEAIPLKETTAVDIARALEEDLFARHGFPECIHSDNGRNISGEVIKEVCRMLNIRKTTTPEYNPKSNPVERAHRDLGSLLRAIMEETHQTWRECLPTALLAMRTTRCRSTGFTPFFLTYGREANLPVDITFGSEPTFKFGPIEYANRLYQRLQESFKKARTQQQTTTERARQAYNHQVDEQALDMDRLVWLFTPKVQPGQSKKLHSRWTGPWKITAVVSNVLRRICTAGNWNNRALEFVTSIDRLKPFSDRPPTETPFTIRLDLTLDDVAHPEMENRETTVHDRSSAYDQLLMDVSTAADRRILNQTLAAGFNDLRRNRESLQTESDEQNPERHRSTIVNPEVRTSSPINRGNGDFPSPEFTLPEEDASLIWETREPPMWFQSLEAQYLEPSFCPEIPSAPTADNDNREQINDEEVHSGPPIAKRVRYRDIPIVEDYLQPRTDAVTRFLDNNRNRGQANPENDNVTARRSVRIKNRNK